MEVNCQFYLCNGKVTCEKFLQVLAWFLIMTSYHDLLQWFEKRFLNDLLSIGKNFTQTRPVNVDCYWLIFSAVNVNCYWLIFGPLMIIVINYSVALICKGLILFPLVIDFFYWLSKIIDCIPIGNRFYSWLSKNHRFSSTVDLLPRAKRI